MRVTNWSWFDAVVWVGRLLCRASFVATILWVLPVGTTVKPLMLMTVKNSW